MRAVLLAAILSLAAAFAGAASVEGPAPTAWARSLNAFFAAPTADFTQIQGIAGGLRSLKADDPALKEVAAELQASARVIVGAPPSLRATEAELKAASDKLAVLNEPAFRNLLEPEQQRLVGAAFWAYQTHLIADVRQDVWTPSSIPLKEKIDGIARALDEARGQAPAGEPPALRQDPGVSVVTVDGDAAQLPADALLAAVQPSGFCHGGINAMIEKACGPGIRAQVDAQKPLTDGKTFLTKGDAASKAKFKDVVFVADDMRQPLHQLVFKGLKAADEAGVKTISLPVLRTGWNFGFIEKTYEHVVAETIKGLNLFLEGGRKSLGRISLVVHQNPRLLSLFQSVKPADPEREQLRRAKLSGQGYELTPRPAAVPAKDLKSPIHQDMLEPWDLKRMLKRRAPLRIGSVDNKPAFSAPVASVLNLPIKMPGTGFKIPAELSPMREFLQKIIDYEAASNPKLGEFYAYLTVDRGFVKKGDTHRRPGIHIDGVQGSRYPEKLPPEHTYSASDAVGTVFYAQSFDLRHINPDRDYIHGELERQADEKNAVKAADYGIYFWDSYSAHRAALADEDAERTFVRVEFSRKVYDSVGDTVNPLFDYDWKRLSRPIPYELNWHAEGLSKVVYEKGRRANTIGVDFAPGTPARIKTALLKRARAKRADDVAPIARALAREPAVSRIKISSKIPKIWDLVTDYPNLDGRTAYPELGRPVDDGAAIEGSKKGGGSQPDFIVDHSDPDLRKRVLAPARRIGAFKADDWTKLARLQAVVNAALPKDGWSFAGNDPAYDAFIESVKGRERLSLGDYIRLGIGVCRENAIMTVVALRAAGYKARFAYFTVLKDDGVVDQDHAVALVEVDGTTYVLDSYRALGRYYNGHRLLDLMSPPADGAYALAGPLAKDNASAPGRWKFVLNSFPRVR